MRDTATHARARVTDGALAVALACAGVLELALAPAPRNALNDPHAPLVAAGFAAACLTVLLARRHAVLAGCAIGALVLGEGAVGVVAHNAGALWLVVYVIAYAIGAFEARHASVLGLVAMLAAFEGGILLAGDAWVPGLFAVAPWAAGRVVRSQREIVAALAQRTHELEAEQDAYARLAVHHERARIARELHDVVSHNLAGVVVQAGAGRVATSLTPDRASRRFARIRQAGEQGLQELSRLAEIIRDDTTDPIPNRPPLDLSTLFDHARAAGLTVRHDTSPADLRLPRQIDDTAYRIVQEALTNTIKHAPGAEVTVRTALSGDMLELDVRDDGGGAHAIADLRTSGSGIGLNSMGARAADVGGTLRAGLCPDGGWRVSAHLPMRPAHGSPPEGTADPHAV